MDEGWPLRISSLILDAGLFASCGDRRGTQGAPATTRVVVDTGVDAPLGEEVGDTPAATNRACTGAANGDPCDDGDGCTGRDVCQDQRCVGLDPIICAGAGPCQTAGACDPATGLCSSPRAIANGTTCDDGDACTTGDSCRNGACLAAAKVTCFAGPCKVAGTCDPLTGACTEEVAERDGSACDDGNRCTTGDSCLSGRCMPGVETTCRAPPCKKSACDPLTGACRAPVPESDGVACEDQDLCTQSSGCLAGTCVGSQRTTCGSAGPCRENGSCDPKTGKCVTGPVPDGRPCDDGNACTVDDFCQAGACQVGSMVSCPALGCRDAGSCDASSGRCLTGPAKVDGTACEDGNLCTRDDSCHAGACVGGNTVMCAVQGKCRDPGSCDPTTGMCRPGSNKRDGTACDDGDPCTQNDECRTGNCLGGAQLECRTTSACETSASCSRHSGLCEVVVRLPVVQRLIGPIRQSETVVLRGTGLANSRVTLGGRAVGLGSSSDTQLTINIPTDQAVGRTDLVVTNGCGEDRLTVDVVPHPPRIVSLEPPTPAPDGVLLIRTEFADRSQLLAVQIGDVEIPTSDPLRFSWPNPRNPNDVGLIGVRIPANAAPGAVGLKLIGRAGPSDGFMLDIKAASGTRHPPSLSSVMFTPAQAEDDDIFPIVRNGNPGPWSAFDPARPSGPRSSVVYLWRFQDVGVGSCLGKGNIGGYEKFCDGDCGIARECMPPATCHDIAGTYQLNSQGNWIDVDIDRRPSGGTKEHYKGGWRSSVQGDAAAVSEDSHLIVLRSQLTGRQIGVWSPMLKERGWCNHWTFP